MEGKLFYRFDNKGYFVEVVRTSGYTRFVNPHIVTEIVGYEPYMDEQGNEALRPVMGERTVYDEESYVPDDLTDVKPPDSPGFYRAKWTGTEWVEGGSPPEEPEPPELPPGQISEDEINFLRGLYDGAGGDNV